MDCKGYTIHYNFVRPHQTLKGKNLAQTSGLNIKNARHVLVKEAPKYKTLLRRETETQLLEVA